MKNRSGKNKRKRKTDTKPNGKTEPHGNARSMSNTTTIVVCMVVPLLLGGFANFFAHKGWILYLPLAGFLVFIGYAGHLGIRHLTRATVSQNLATKAEPSFSITCATLISTGERWPLNRDHVTPWLWLTEQGNDRILSPVTDLLYIRFTNLDRDPMLIDFYGLEVRQKDKPWTKATRINANRGKLVTFIGPGRKQAVEVNFSDQVFDWLIRKKPIKSQDTVLGWIFVERPDGYIGEMEWRFTVKDIRERKNSVLVTFLEGGTKTMNMAEIPIGSPIDLSNTQLKFYSEVNPYEY